MIFARVVSQASTPPQIGISLENQVGDIERTIYVAVDSSDLLRYPIGSQLTLIHWSKTRSDDIAWRFIEDRIR